VHSGVVGSQGLVLLSFNQRAHAESERKAQVSAQQSHSSLLRGIGEGALVQELKLERASAVRYSETEAVQLQGVPKRVCRL